MTAENVSPIDFAWRAVSISLINLLHLPFNRCLHEHDTDLVVRSQDAHVDLNHATFSTVSNLESPTSRPTGGNPTRRRRAGAETGRPPSPGPAATTPRSSSTTEVIALNQPLDSTVCVLVNWLAFLYIDLNSSASSVFSKPIAFLLHNSTKVLYQMQNCSTYLATLPSTVHS